VNGVDQPGKAYLYLGGPAGIATTATPIELDARDGVTAQFARTVNAGDVNGDGYADLFVGSPGAAVNGAMNAGKAYLYLGGAGGIAADATPIELDGRDGGFSGFGTTATSAGDVNGDGYDDLLVSAPAAAVNGNVAAGKLYVYLGGVDGIAADATPIELDGRDPTSSFGVYAEFGSSAAGAGDLNGDGYADLVGGTASATANGNAFAGKVYLYYSSGVNGIAASATPVELDGSDGGHFGTCVQ
jgi:hypothetical protein